MKQFALSAMAIAATLLTTACTGKKAENQAETKSPKCLVIYYSQSGTTKTVAEEFQRQLGADIEAIEAETPYDGDFMATVQRFQQENQNQVSAAIKPIKSNINNYDVIFIGYPIWGGTFASPMSTFIASQTFEGKKVVLFCTFGSGGLEGTVEALKTALPKAQVITSGYGLRTARLASATTEIERFLIENGFVTGQVEQLPNYSDQIAVTDDEIAIFNTACGDYQFPLGTPVTCGKRTTSTSTDYMFVAKSAMPNGAESQSTIYVTISNAENAKAEFTRVVR